MSLKEKIQDLIAKGYVEKGIDELLKWASTNNSELHNDSISLKARFAANKRAEYMGTADSGDISRENNKITQSLLALLGQLETPSSGRGNAPPEHHGTAPEPSGAGGKMTLKTILFLASNPEDTGKLQLEKEYQSVQDVAQNKFDFKLKRAVRVDELQMSIYDYKPDILHFSGHGKGDKTTGGGNLNAPKRGAGSRTPEKTPQAGLMIMGDDNKSVLVPSAALDSMLRVLGKRQIKIHTVVLNACFSAVHADAFLPHVKYLIGMTDAIGDADAIKFAEAFYQWLVRTDGDVEFSFENALVNLQLNNYQDNDKPKLMLGKG
jgi:hypothetical protein